jgi:hypothetical protein
VRGKFVLFLEFYLVVPLKKFAEKKQKGMKSDPMRKTKKLQLKKTHQGPGEIFYK